MSEAGLLYKKIF